MPGKEYLKEKRKKKGWTEGRTSEWWVCIESSPIWWTTTPRTLPVCCSTFYILMLHLLAFQNKAEMGIPSLCHTNCHDSVPRKTRHVSWMLVLKLSVDLPWGYPNSLHFVILPRRSLCACVCVWERERVYVSVSVLVYYTDTDIFNWIGQQSFCVCVCVCLCVRVLSVGDQYMSWENR